MFKWLKASGRSSLGVSVVLTLATLCVGIEPVAAQIQRQIEPNIVYKTAPVVITKIAYNGVTVQAGRFVKPWGEAVDPVTPFAAGDDWVENLTIQLFNRTNQTVVQLSMDLSFPETKTYSPRFVAGCGVTIGQIPPSILLPNGMPMRQRPSPPLSLRPGATMQVNLRDYIDQIKAKVEPTKPLAQLTAMEVRVIGMVFEGGMRWMGSFEVQDPQSHLWQRFGRDCFPGDMDLRWPGLPGWIDQQ